MYIMTHIAKVLEVIGNSDKSWQDAAQAALDEAKKTVHRITGIEITDMTAKVAEEEEEVAVSPPDLILIPFDTNNSAANAAMVPAVVINMNI
ncbi:MAG: dodecin family protein [Nitrososphaeraceae archaeon]